MSLYDQPVRPRCACGWFLKDAEPVIGYYQSDWDGGPFIKAVKGACARHGYVESTACLDWDYWFDGSIDPLDQPVEAS